MCPLFDLFSGWIGGDRVFFCKMCTAFFIALPRLVSHSPCSLSPVVLFHAADLSGLPPATTHRLPPRYQCAPAVYITDPIVRTGARPPERSGRRKGGAGRGEGTGLPTTRGEGRREGRRKVVGDGRLGTGVVAIERVKVCSDYRGPEPCGRLSREQGRRQSYTLCGLEVPRYWPRER